MGLHAKARGPMALQGPMRVGGLKLINKSQQDVAARDSVHATVFDVVSDAYACTCAWVEETSTDQVASASCSQLREEVEQRAF